MPLKVGLWEQAKTRNQEVISNVSLDPISGTRIIERFAPRPYYFASEDEDLLKEVDEAISIIKQVQPSLPDVLFDKYFRNTRYVFAPTQQQKDYLKSMDTLEVLCVERDAPYVYQKEGKPAGMMVEILNSFAEETGVSINYTFCQSRDEAEQKLKEESYDLMIGLSFDSEYCARLGFVRSKSIMESNLAYLHRSENSSHKTVAIEKGMESLVDTTEFQEVIKCDNIVQCMEAVTNGRADYAVGDRSALEYYMYDTYSTLVTGLISGSAQNICIAIARESNLQFIRLVNDYIYSLSDLQKTTFLEEGNMHLYKTSLRGYVRMHPIQTMLLFSGLTAFIVVACSMMFHAKQMHKKNMELEMANQAKSEFLTRMSHDIRTPMNVIMGFTNIALQHADDSDKMKECLEKIRVSGSNLQELIDDVLDISRIESGEFKIVSQLVKLPELFDFYCQAIAGMAEAKNIRFSGKLHDISHNVLLSDQIRLGQIYMNLLSNAVKYMPENGDVKLEVYEEKLAESGKVRLVSVVSDTGIGMTPEFMEQMYSAFSRAVDTRVNKVRGSGLGLAIVKKIVDLMGGAIGAESKVGKGTTFRVTLDLPAAADDAETEEHTETAITLPEKPLTVLVAEDNDLNYEITAEQLRGYRVHCVRAVNGQDCLQRIEQAAPDEFDAILMDMQMPVMNGLEATAAIRKLDSETAKNIPIIALIANAYHEDIQKCLAAGMNAHLSKPINIDRAVRTIIECARTAKGNG